VTRKERKLVNKKSYALLMDKFADMQELVQDRTEEWIREGGVELAMQRLEQLDGDDIQLVIQV